ncbi:MAG: dTMP kinase [bacterium TMED88]|nr:dTMP kinase [Deltaproteobacteria bacterium]OUV30712.1 MAG: dTMP kinase [bacterium TMED88]
MVQGSLVALEGIDGAGKGTQVDLLVTALRSEGLSVVATREPTDGPHGRQIRARSVAGEVLSPNEQLEAFMLDRAEHVRDLIRPALDEGSVVVTDRYYLSNVAYQGAAGLDPAEILENNAARFPEPDLAILIDLSAEEALRRVDARGEQRNRVFERESFLTRTREIYCSLQLPYLHSVSGETDPQTVHVEIMARVRTLLGRRAG